MNERVALLHDDYPSRVRDLVTGKLEQLDRFFDGTVSLRATLERQRNEHRVEVVATVRRGIVLVAEGRRESLTAALEQALTRMGRVLRRHKGRRRRSRGIRGS